MLRSLFSSQVKSCRHLLNIEDNKNLSFTLLNFTKVYLVRNILFVVMRLKIYKEDNNLSDLDLSESVGVDVDGFNSPLLLYGISPLKVLTNKQ